jgi:truncated hemoglobin YjbI
MSLYEQYGGFATIHIIVREFYKDILDDDLLSRYFQNTQ